MLLVCYRTGNREEEKGQMERVKNLLSDESSVTIYFSNEYLHIQAAGKALLTIPLKNFPRLERATVEQRNNFRLSYRGVHWETLDEDINIGALYAGAIKDMTNQ
ncbi:DUF2442 domain-containing protein [Dickeya solani]|nr:DUF2442 domain-containing protein [Dickeya solani]MZG60371.1 DUF2442 domain-containing protein [Dickeya solani]MZH12730.1 DUF2442 domain-containing protein [Dickeya solani]MZH49911.1 DUF2442 domain-containing protein [Dickeya solani]MZI97731.1 DUF2442 domain-containing protein [Dickeya solani]